MLRLAIPPLRRPVAQKPLGWQAFVKKVPVAVSLHTRRIATPRARRQPDIVQRQIVIDGKRVKPVQMAARVTCRLVRNLKDARGRDERPTTEGGVGTPPPAPVVRHKPPMGRDGKRRVFAAMRKQIRPPRLLKPQRRKLILARQPHAVLYSPLKLPRISQPPRPTCPYRPVRPHRTDNFLLLIL